MAGATLMPAQLRLAGRFASCRRAVPRNTCACSAGCVQTPLRLAGQPSAPALYASHPFMRTPVTHSPHSVSPHLHQRTQNRVAQPTSPTPPLALSPLHCRPPPHTPPPSHPPSHEVDHEPHHSRTVHELPTLCRGEHTMCPTTIWIRCVMSARVCRGGSMHGTRSRGRGSTVCCCWCAVFPYPFSARHYISSF